MATYDYFYTFDNFIGYTGNLDKDPTLYFMDNTHYGRITTNHPNAQNIGRSSPKLLVGYSHGNKVLTKQGERFVEKNARLGKSHTSRNLLVECTSSSDRNKVKSRVLELIAANTKVKEKDDEASQAPHEFPQGPIWENRLK